MIDYYIKLFSKYRSKGLLLDTNILLLLIVGSYDQKFITAFKRTKVYSVEDYFLLVRVIRHFKKLIVTPHVLAELSNLSEKIASDKLLNYFSNLISQLEDKHEVFVPKSDIFLTNIIHKVGITDASLFDLACKNKCLIMTTDFQLAGLIKSKNADVINFTELRTPLLLDKF